MTKSIFLVLLIIISVDANATKQIDDTLRVGRSSFFIRELPLRGLDEWNEYAEKTEFQMCTGSWRGYIASWKIREGYLWLEGIQKNPCNFEEYEFIEANEYSLNEEYPLKAEWFSGERKIQIDETKYIYKTSEEKELAGADYEALVFVFMKGKLIEKKIKLIQSRYEH